MPLGKWSDRLPLPDAAPTPGSENESVTNVFLGALGWILRHELAHIILRHQETDTADRMKEDEFAADAQASRWLMGTRKADEGRTPGAAIPGRTRT
jgi:Peptidase U49